MFLILGNDDPRSNEPIFQYGSETGAWNYVHGRKTTFGGFDIYGYSCVPPTPFHLKDWERYASRATSIRAACRLRKVDER